jgi:hypothetical protein
LRSPGIVAAAIALASSGCKSDEQKKHDSCRQLYERSLKPKLEPELKAAEAALRAWAETRDPGKLHALSEAQARAEAVFDAVFPTPNECFVVLTEPDFNADFHDRLQLLGELSDGLGRVEQLAASSAPDDVVAMRRVTKAARVLAPRVGSPSALTTLAAMADEYERRVDEMNKREDERLRQKRDAPPTCDEAVAHGREALQQARDSNCVNERGELITDVARSECGTVNAAVVLRVRDIANACRMNQHNATRAVFGLPPE